MRDDDVGRVASAGGRRPRHGSGSGRDRRARRSRRRSSRASASVTAHSRPPASSTSAGSPARTSSSVARAARGEQRGELGRRAAVPASSAATTGALRLPARRSDDADLPVTRRVADDAEHVVDQLERHAQLRRRTRPGRATTSAAAPGGARRRSRPSRPAARRSCRPPCRRTSSSVDVGAAARERGRRDCPPISRWVARSRCGSAAAAVRRRRAAAPRWPRSSIALPARMASPSPNTTQPVGRCRRSTSRSMTSSCSSEKLCTSSTATAPGTPRRRVAAPAVGPRAAPAPGACALPPRVRRGRRRRRHQPSW